MNVILVMSDTFRRDNLSCYGPTQVKTPNLDRLASQSYVFDNAFLGSFPTLPNRMDIMSGRFSFVDHEWCPLPKETITLQQILSASGVVTQAVVDNPHLIESGFNYERGFDGWEWVRGQESDIWKSMPRDVNIPADPSKMAKLHVLSSHLRNTAWWKAEEDRFVARTVTEACKWLEEGQHAEKFFLYVDLFDPHEPWDAPEKYLKLYETDYQGQAAIYPRQDYWQEFLTKEELDHVRALYMAETTMVDHWVGVLWDKVKKLGLEEDTVLIFTSDHGYFFGEHGRMGKAFNPPGGAGYESCRLFAELRQVPLIIHMPGQKKGEHSGALVQSPDLFPTILEMCGLVATESVGGKSNIQALQCGIFYTEKWKFDPESIHGKSLMPVLRGETDRLRDIAVCSNTLIHHTPIVAKCAVVTEDGWCLHYAGEYGAKMQEDVFVNRNFVSAKPQKEKIEAALYYLPDDPQEEHDVIGENEQRAREIHRRYVEWLEEAGTPEEHLEGRRQIVVNGRAGK